ncbi:SH3 domain-containing protein [Streptomyces sp. SRF1]|uniref:SH3 domain-containing protein n=1 Tax=Streptomyces sp. SRF1 TaxID=1549642 RepID=UPI0025B0385F|nr:SH3 domain-containing protein [Streptomyces sp. SRF1]MDN3058601.1 SH3 domain-containing protein [Streptomyces sp. SRF1]
MAIEEIAETTGTATIAAASATGATVATEATVVTAATDATDATATAGSTAAAVTYPIAPGYQVNVRSGPGTTYKVVKVLPYNSRVPIRCQRHGQKVSGPYGTSDIWDSIAPGQYVSDAYVRTGSDGFVAAPCG